MDNFISIIWSKEQVNQKAIAEAIVGSADVLLTENEAEYFMLETDEGEFVLRIAIAESLDQTDSDSLAEEIAEKIFDLGLKDFAIEISAKE